MTSEEYQKWLESMTIPSAQPGAAPVIAPPGASGGANPQLQEWQKQMFMLQKQVSDKSKVGNSPWNFQNFTGPKGTALEKTFSPNPWENAVAY